MRGQVGFAGAGDEHEGKGHRQRALLFKSEEIGAARQAGNAVVHGARCCAVCIECLLIQRSVNRKAIILIYIAIAGQGDRPIGGAGVHGKAQRATLRKGHIRGTYDIVFL